MIQHGVRENIKALERLFPSTAQTVAILSVMAFLSVMLIDYLYKVRRDE